MEKLKIKKNNIKIQANLLYVGEDILVIISGGDKPHIGAAVLTNQNQFQSISFKAHKDDIALAIIANELKKYTDKNICVMGGIHVDNITQKEIKQVLKMSKKLAKKLRSVLFLQKKW